MVKNYTRRNFHTRTFCIWNEVSFDAIKELKINYTSQSGSQYIFTENGLYRISNHWGRVADCHWRLIPMTEFKNQNNTVAFAKWIDFYANDDTSKLFFIKVNWETQEVNFYHKLTASDSAKVILRNAKETAKIIRIIKEVFTETDWAKYLQFDDLTILRKEVVKELIDSEKSFLEIKKRYLN
ncbi:hypothetical protein [Flavobacterium sp.]|uniref:hypothetical protein n=1 Tax=Flavobacterium sp. TaxID=239 RepID=UPI002FD8A8EC